MKNNNDEIDVLLGKSVLSSEIFLENTKLKKLPKKIQDSKYWPKDWKTIFYKGYERFDEIILPKPKFPAKISFKEVISKRKSSREFSDSPLDIDKLSTLLFYSAGINEHHELNERRFYPSPGARYPLEVYVLSKNTSNISNGLYHYYIKSHSLEEILLFNKDINYRKFFNQEWIEKAPVVIIITAIIGRNTGKYGERGYRHILVEAGHMAQNLYLLSSALDLSCCAVGGFIDDNLNKLLDIDGKDEVVVYVLAAGDKNRF